MANKKKLVKEILERYIDEPHKVAVALSDIGEILSLKHENIQKTQNTIPFRESGIR